MRGKFDYMGDKTDPDDPANYWRRKQPNCLVLISLDQEANDTDRIQSQEECEAV